VAESLAFNRLVDAKKRGLFRFFTPHSTLRTPQFQDLDWMVMKALAKDRDRRYDTASAFAADVQRYLDDEPVEACPPSAAYRFGKFVRRHKGLLLATAVVLLSLVTGMLGTTWALIEARALRRQAQANGRTARQAVDEQFTLVSEGALLEDPAQEPLRRQLLQAALRYYERFVQEQGNDPELRAELVAAHLRIANITHALGSEDWLPPFQKGVAILEDLLRTRPDVTTLRSLQAGIYRPLGAIVTVRRPAETLRAFEKARALWEQLVGEHPTVAGFRSDLAAWHATLGFLHSLNEQPEEAARCCQRACDLREELMAANPGVPRYPAALVLSLHELAKQRTKLGQLAQAEAASRRALGLAKKLVRAYPQMPAYQEILAQVYNKLGQGWGHARRLEDMEQARREALAGCDRLAQAFPTVARYRTEQFIAQWRVANLLWDTGRRAEAREAYRRMTTLAESLNLGSPPDQELLACFLATCWDSRLRDPPRAVALARKAVACNPRTGTFWNTLGVAHYRAGDWGRASAALHKAMALRKGGDPGDWFFLAMAHWQRGEKGRARPWYDRAARWMDRHAPKKEEWRHFRAEAEELLGIKRGQ
jgi:tetratricopeptide (TPR) repeat protein